MFKFGLYTSHRLLQIKEKWSEEVTAPQRPECGVFVFSNITGKLSWWDFCTLDLQSYRDWT